MNKQTKIIGALLGAALATASGVAVAESQYGYAPYSAAPSAAVTAQASVKLTVQVPKLILLRVGSYGSTIDEVTWALAPLIPLAPSGTHTPSASINNTVVDWSGAAPTFSANSSTNAVSVWAWTNAGPGKIGCAAPTWNPTTGPSNSDISVTSTGGVAHPTSNLGCTDQPTFSTNAPHTGTWTYGLATTSAPNWAAGAYSATVLYTATSI